MGWRFRRSIRVMPGVRLNLSRRGIGFSAGPRGLKVGRGADGKYRRTLSVPGTGLYNTSVIGSGRRRIMGRQQQPGWGPPQQQQGGWVPPPGWGQQQAPQLQGWTPTPGWGQGPPPPETPPGLVAAKAWVRKHPKSTAAGAVLGLLLVGGVAAGGNDEPPAERQGIVQAADESTDERADQAAEEDAAAEAAEEAAAAKAAEEQAAAAAAAKAAEEAAAKAAAEQAAREAAEQAAAAEAARVASEQQAAAEAAARAEAERQAAAAQPPEVSYANCTEVRAAGAAPIHRGEPGYASHLDRDDDGIACDTKS